LSAGLDADTATERNKPKQQKTAAPKTGCTRRKNERDQEERGTPKHAAREKSRTGNALSNQPTKWEATTPEPAAQPAAKTATGETGKTGRFRIASNAKLSGLRAFCAVPLER